MAADKTTDVLDKQNALPLHIQFERIVRQKIEDEDWVVNSPIPSENELSRIYGLSRMTVRSVLNRLQMNGLIYRIPGKGTFIAEPKITSEPLVKYGIREQLEAMGYETSTSVIGVKKSLSTLKVAKSLGLAKKVEVFTVKRVRGIKGKPLSFHVSCLPARYFRNLEKCDLENNQMCHLIERKFKYPIRRRIETLEATSATLEESQYLNIEPGFPLLLLENIVYTDKNLVIEYSQIKFRGDKYKIRMEYAP
ncbi:MAG: GntR family transcriptional regulator [Treponema sp.]|jgi:GntR family transcriptional regulator|nr:GntR family transcriptional regulator [Treponema sp.]